MYSEEERKQQVEWLRKNAQSCGAVYPCQVCKQSHRNTVHHNRGQFGYHKFEAPKMETPDDITEKQATFTERYSDPRKTTLIRRRPNESVTDYTLRCMQTWRHMQIGNAPDIEELLRDRVTDRRQSNR